MMKFKRVKRLFCKCDTLNIPTHLHMDIFLKCISLHRLYCLTFIPILIWLTFYNTKNKFLHKYDILSRLHCQVLNCP